MQEDPSTGEAPDTFATTVYFRLFVSLNGAKAFRTSRMDVKAAWASYHLIMAGVLSVYPPDEGAYVVDPVVQILRVTCAPDGSRDGQIIDGAQLKAEAETALTTAG